MKRIIFYLILFASLCGLGSYAADTLAYQKVANQSPIYLSFASIGANSLESRLDCWATINHKLDEEQRERIILDIMDDLGLSQGQKRDFGQAGGSNNLASFNYQADGLFLDISSEASNDKDETYFLLNVTSRKNDYDLEKMEKRLSQGDLDWHFYYLYTGKLDHYLDRSSREAIMQVIMDNLSAGKGDMYADEYMISSSSYSRRFENYILVQDRKYNLQVAVRSTPGQQETTIYIGQPLIIGDY